MTALVTNCDRSGYTREVLLPILITQLTMLRDGRRYIVDTLLESMYSSGAENDLLAFVARG